MPQILHNTFLLCLGTLGLLKASHASPTKPAGLIDLGYAKHIPTYVNTTESGRNISVYKNIRFANSPTGDLRFRLPDTNIPDIEGVQDGNFPPTTFDCISSAPKEAPFPPLNGTTWGQEDCLFLDVYVPDNVKPGDSVPVLHFFVGSGFAFGSKDIFVLPNGLFDVTDDENKFIFVANNYRLGVPGWSYLPGEDMVANAGMHDCLAAAEWTAKYISRFGGDPDRITAMGQSAGAGIIGLSTVLNGGEGAPPPYKQAVIASPAIPPRRNVLDRQKKLFQAILDQANCTSLECLRCVPEDTISSMNEYFINQVKSDAGGGLFGPSPGFGPTVDFEYIPDMPQILFEQGKYHKTFTSLIVGNTANEGMGISSDLDDIDGGFRTLVRRIFTTASNETIEYIQSHYDYAENPAKLAWDWTTDVIFGCNAANIASAFKDVASRYLFSAPPATHGQDMLYFFYINQNNTPVEKPEDAKAYQRNLLEFVYGREIDWPVFGDSKQITNMTGDGYETVPLPEDLEARCKMVNEISQDPENGV